MLFSILCKAQNNGVTGYKLPNGIKYYPEKIFPVVDHNDNIWFTPKGGELLKFNIQSKQFTIYDSTNTNIGKVLIQQLIIDAQNNVWGRTINSIFKFDGSSFTFFNKANTPELDAYLFELDASDKRIYVATNKGIAYFDNNSWAKYDSLNSGLIDNYVQHIKVISENYFWTFNKQNKLREFRNGMWTDINTNIDFSFPINHTGDTMIVYGDDLYLYKYYNQNFYATLVDSPYVQFNLQGNIAGIFKNDVSYKMSRGYFSVYDKSGLSIYKDSRYGWKFVISKTGDIYSFSFIQDDSLYNWDLNKYDPYNEFESAMDRRGKILHINNTACGITGKGSFHFNWNNSYGLYEVPKGSGIHAVYASALWVGGLDASNNLHIAAQTYRQTGDDFFEGPIDTITMQTDSVSLYKYDRVWRIHRYEVEEFKYNYEYGQVQNGNYIIPRDILQWPANGILNQARILAPYIDIDLDGVYDPYKGDYPDIKGDQFIYWIMNDVAKDHTCTMLSTKIGTEIHCSAYAYYCPQPDSTTETINYTTFYNYKFFNRSDTNYHDMYVGLWCDVDLGNYHDDYVGCDTILNAGFVYNGDNDDESFNGYGLNPPMLNIKVLQGPEPLVNDNLDNDNDGAIDEQGEQCLMNAFIHYDGINGVPWGNPDGASDYYNYMRAKDFMGNPITYGGDGHNPNNPPTHFFLSGVPYDSVGWSEYLQANPPGDRRIMLSSGPFNLDAHAMQEIDFAYLYTRDATAPNGLHTSIAKNKKQLQQLQSMYDNNLIKACIEYTFPIPIDSSLNVDSNLLVFPNPAVYSITLNMEDSLLSIATAKIFNRIGQQVYSASLITKQISIEHLVRGMYFITIEYGAVRRSAKFLKW